MDGNRQRVKPGVAAFAGMMMPGLGYAYAGKLGMAIGYNAIFMTVVFLVGRFVVPISPVGFWLISLIVVVWYVGSPLSTFIYLRGIESTQASFTMIIASFLIVPIFVFCVVVGMGEYKMQVFGYDLHKVDGDSSAFRRGDLVFVSGEKIGEGDMVAYRSQDNGSVIIRKAYNVTDDTFRTKVVGFGSITLEDIVLRSALIGRVTKKWSPDGALKWIALDALENDINDVYISVREAVALDRELNESYQQIIAALPSDEQTKLRDAERIWIKYRDATCQTKDHSPEQWIREKTEGDMEVRCIGRLTRERIEELKRKYPIGIR